ncbi:hypothetical protein EYZ11_004400 [Aspergillus tanneri]|uniref:Aminoglycoside phosphotransferase domain-containing protein n=1 Tax=Aspergillus tanneri TaxID=1220188 RepID=A0A4S3JKP4_9EURO|nr:uncharacterized protein ATNIH1004_006177 [Aspergillus tanneri]KAA8647484.1 hypothetical protein ATNIH1004_006177 [Aspergillus tanneri]THC96126.1 hypothetical protein EYZ11_004400 [Aspergillus tanneri]
MDDLAELPEILRKLSYACGQLERLSGGTANFVYRGTLQSDETTSVIVKHTKNYVASNRTFQIPAERCLIEESILKTLGDFPPTTTPSLNGEITIKTPHVLAFDRDSFTLVMEDLPKAVDLKTFLTASETPPRVSCPWATAVGLALGHWLGEFHAWTAHPARAHLVSKMQTNGSMRDLKFQVNYENLVGLVDTYPDLLGESQSIFKELRDLARSELGREDGEGFGVIHGDFWSGNVLLPRDALDQTDTTTIPLFVIDWELAHCGPRALDLGQMMAELYFVKHFRDVDAGLWIIEGLTQTYPSLSEDVAYRAIMHVGVHFICWGTMLTDWGTPDQVRAVVSLGRDLIVRAWRREREWFEAGFWGCLFR